MVGWGTDVHGKGAHNGTRIVCEQWFVFCHPIGNVVRLNQVEKVCVETSITDGVNDLLDPIPDLVYVDEPFADL
jgi:hypothetical protein